MNHISDDLDELSWMPATGPRRQFQVRSILLWNYVSKDLIFSYPRGTSNLKDLEGFQYVDEF